MQFQFPDFVLAFVVTAALCFLSAVMIWRRRINPGSVPFAFLMLSLFAWSFASIFEAGVLSAEGKTFWSKWQYLGITTISPLWLLFTSQYIGKEKYFKNNLRWLIWIIPIATLFLAFTNEYHQLIWTDVAIKIDTWNIGDYSHGFVFYIHTAYSYICLLIGTIWLVRDILTGKKNQQFQSVLLIIAVFISWAANVLYILGLIPIPGLDVTPLSFSLVALMMTFSISRRHLFDLVPIARNALLDSMVEGVIVIDPNDIVLEINPAALKITKYEGPPPVGRSIWDVFDMYSDVIDQFRDQTNLHSELMIPADEEKVVDLHITNIKTDGEESSGQLIVFRDITKQKEVERVEKEQRAFAEALASTAAIINSSLVLNDVLEKILVNLAKVVPHEAANIALVSPEGTARFVKANNPEKYGPKGFLLNLDFNIFEIGDYKLMSETRKGKITVDTRSDEGWNKVIEGSEWIRSSLATPIFHQDELLGFINLDAGVPNFFKPEHAERLEIFSNYAASAIMNAKLYSDTRFYAEEMAILYEISLAIAAGVGLEKTTQAVFRQLKKVIPTDLFFLALYEQTEKMVSYFMYKQDGERIDIEPFYLMQKTSMTRHVIQKKETVYIPDFETGDTEVKEEDVIIVSGFDIRSFLGIPLILRGEVIGVLSVQCAKPNAYTPRQIRLVETIAQQATIAMDNAKLFEKMQEMAITDSLTGLYNRRYFYMILKNEIERTKRYKSPLSLIMMDIDHFKLVNDKFGHLAGDRVLQSIAEVSQQLLRQSDNMYRYGGEEFMILLPETNQNEALKVAERIRSTIAETIFKTKRGGVKVTTSIGVSQYVPDYSAPNSFIESADKALYDAKQAGRNCVHIYSS